MKNVLESNLELPVAPMQLFTVLGSAVESESDRGESIGECMIVIVP